MGGQPQCCRLLTREAQGQVSARRHILRMDVPSRHTPGHKTQPRRITSPLGEVISKILNRGYVANFPGCLIAKLTASAADSAAREWTVFSLAEPLVGTPVVCCDFSDGAISNLGVWRVPLLGEGLSGGGGQIRQFRDRRKLPTGEGTSLFDCIFQKRVQGAQQFALRSPDCGTAATTGQLDIGISLPQERAVMS